MAKEYEIEVFGQQSLYRNLDRKFKIYFSEPDNGINDLTGIILLINGYGANPKSNVYVKMRNEFSDKYNLIAIQCEYFGMEFMQTDSNIDLSILTEKEKILSQSKNQSNDYYVKKIYKSLNEKLEDMNDMGPIQAIDNLTALKVMFDIVKSNNLNINKNKIIAYGHSHGAYIAHLCNLFSPNVFSSIIDNSGYMYPAYLKENSNRQVIGYMGQIKLIITYPYLITKVVFDKELYNLGELYRQIENKCKIIAFQGINDELYNYQEKIEFLSKIKNSKLELITKEKVDNEIFKNTNHGVGADFLKLFDYVNNKYSLENDNEKWGFHNVEYRTKNYIYDIYNELGVPLLKFKKLCAH